jgi:hypothetical protein
MADQWLRSIALDVGEGGPLALGGFALVSSSTDPQMLRVSFSVERDEKPWPNTAEIKLYNLNAEHRKYLAAQRAIPCRLKAGYQSGSLGTLFEGFLRDAQSRHDGTDWVTTLGAGDGELNKDGDPIAGGSIHKTWSRGTPLLTVLKDFCNELKIDLGNVTTAGAGAMLSTGVALSHAFTVDGPGLDELIYLMRSLGMPWSIQDGALQVRATPEVPAATGPLVAAATGLVGSVETSTRKVKRVNTLTKAAEQKELKICSGKCLLLPGLKPGQLFVLTSEAVTGPVLCTVVRHVGDTHGGEWYTEFEGIYG